MSRLLALLAALVLCGCATTTVPVDGDWTAECTGVSDSDCQGIGELFVGNLARSHDAILQESGGVIRISRLPTCPVVPAWADGRACWRASAPTRTTRACMIIARQLDPASALGAFGQVGGDNYSGLVGAPEPGTTPC